MTRGLLPDFEFCDMAQKIARTTQNLTNLRPSLNFQSPSAFPVPLTTQPFSTMQILHRSINLSTLRINICVLTDHLPVSLTVPRYLFTSTMRNNSAVNHSTMRINVMRFHRSSTRLPHRSTSSLHFNYAK